MNTETDLDKRLIRSFQRGDRQAFELFVQRHQDRVFRLASVSARVPADAADITQEVFLRAYTGLTKFRFRSAPFTWLFRTTKNVCREFNRKRRELPLLTDAPEQQEDATGETVLTLEQTVKQVRAMVGRLPERQRDVVLLRVFEEMSVDDTALVMRCRPGTVKALLHKALGRMRRTEFRPTADDKGDRRDEE